MKDVSPAYGPRLDPFDGRVVTNFLRQALERTSAALADDLGIQTEVEHPS